MDEASELLEEADTDRLELEAYKKARQADFRC